MNQRSLGSTHTKDGTSLKKVKTRLHETLSHDKDNSKTENKAMICFLTKIKLYKSLVLSMLLYGCETRR